MSQLHIYRIEQYLKSEFKSTIDLSNFKKSFSEEEREKAFLSRAQCALAIKYLARIDIVTASKAITDGYSDNGIDGIFPTSTIRFYTYVNPNGSKMETLYPQKKKCKVF